MLASYTNVSILLFRQSCDTIGSLSFLCSCTNSNVVLCILFECAHFSVHFSAHSQKKWVYKHSSTHHLSSHCINEGKRKNTSQYERNNRSNNRNYHKLIKIHGMNKLWKTHGTFSNIWWISPERTCFNHWPWKFTSRLYCSRMSFFCRSNVIICREICDALFDKYWLTINLMNWYLWVGSQTNFEFGYILFMSIDRKIRT